MCGISGIISPTLAEEEVLRHLSRMGRLQRHRGPDDQREGVFSAGERRVGLGLVRLAILDLETGMQPIVCPQDGTAVVCNGQIYNHLELKQELADQTFLTRGDVEVVLQAYRRWGLDFLNVLNGMYAGAIYDPRNRRVVLFRDRFGIKPLYYTDDGHNFVFASEIKPLLAGSGRPAELNRSQLDAFFSYRYVPGEETMFSGVRRLPPGAFLVFDLDAGRYEIGRYWEYGRFLEEREISDEAARETFYHLFSDAVRIRLRSDVAVGALISSGIDSSAVAARAVDFYGPTRLFTIAFEEQGYNELSEVKSFLAADPRRFAGCEHLVRSCDRTMLGRLPGIVAALEEPISLGTVLPTDQVCELAGRHLKVVLTGEGADEIFGGYRKFLIEAAAAAYPGLDRRRQQRLEAIYPELGPYLAVRHQDPAERYIQSELLFDAATLGRLLGREARAPRFPEGAMPALDPAAHPVNTAIAFESRARLPDYVILRLDKLSMRHSLETRTPFLDYRLAEFAARLPMRLKVDIGVDVEKMICRQAYEHFGLLDRTTAWRRKQPFTIPLAQWLSEPERLPEVIQEIMRGDMVASQGVLDPAVFAAQAREITGDNIGPHTLVSRADRVLAMIVFTLWYDCFIIGRFYRL